MQLKITTDYAVRAVMYLAGADGVTSSREVSERMKIPREYLIQLCRKLMTAGIIQTVPGRNGGYFLSRQPEDISLLELVQIIEGTTKISRCLEKDCYCSEVETDACSIRRAYTDVQSQMEMLLGRLTIDKIKNA